MIQSGINLVTSVSKTSGVGDHEIIGAFNPDGSAYIHFIPKNASSYLRSWLEKELWIETTSADYILNRQYKINQLAILRDPIDRWVSGITQFLFETFDTIELVEKHWEAILKIITAQPKQDAHTTPQAEFFYGYNLNNFDFIYLEKFEVNKNKIKNWFKKSNLECKQLDSVFQKNQSKEETTKVLISNLILSNLNKNIEFKKIIVNYYKVDYKLIDWIGKNNKWIQ